MQGLDDGVFFVRTVNETEYEICLRYTLNVLWRNSVGTVLLCVYNLGEMTILLEYFNFCSIEYVYVVVMDYV